MIGFSAITILIIFVTAAVVGNVITDNRSKLTLPRPGGPYKVGRAEFDWVDSGRVDRLADPPADKRELVVWAWYPADVTGHARRAPYLPAAWVKVYRRDEGMGKYLEHDLAMIRTHSFDDVRVAGGNRVFPVIVMEPAMGRMPTDYTVFAEALASHGYIVFGINPTDSARVTVFPDGRVVRGSAKGMIPGDAGTAVIRRDARRIGKVWQNDVEFVLNRLHRLDAKPHGRFQGRLDLTRIGIFGHSFGGATAFAVCARDTRCKAGADLDGILWNSTRSQVMKRPFLFVVQKGCGKSCASMRRKYLSARASAWYISIGGTRHFNFSDLPLRLSPAVRSLFGGFIGPIAPRRGLEISNATLLAFFNRTLKGDTQKSLSAELASWPEVHVRSRWQRSKHGRFLHASASD